MAGLIGSLVRDLTGRGQNYNDPRYNNYNSNDNYYNDGRQRYPSDNYQQHDNNNYYDSRYDQNYPPHGQPCSCADCRLANQSLAAGGMPLTRHERRRYQRAERHAWKAQRLGMPVAVSPGPMAVGPGMGCGRGVMCGAGPAGLGMGRRRGGLIRTVAQEIGNAIENRGSSSAQPRAGSSRGVDAMAGDRSVHRRASFDDVGSDEEGGERELPPSYEQATMSRRKSVEVLMPEGKASRR